jgi:hypothetical protein
VIDVGGSRKLYLREELREGVMEENNTVDVWVRVGIGWTKRKIYNKAAENPLGAFQDAELLEFVII